MNPFYISSNVKIYFGENVTEQALRKECSNHEGNIMIVTTGRSLREHGHLNRVESILRDTVVQDASIIVFEHISNNPDISEIEEAIKEGTESEIRTVIGFGGGSAMDAAKVVAAGLYAEHTASFFLKEEKAPDKRSVRLIVIPTTAGTGSELSRAAIISDRKNKLKTGIRGATMEPDVAITDPSFTWTAGQKVTMETGFDALTHSIETYVAKKNTPFSEIISQAAICNISCALRRLKKNLEDRDARRDMSFYSMLIGMNLKDVGTCLPHRLQYPLGSLSETSHAVGLAALYPSWIACEYEADSQKTGNVMKWICGEDVHNATEVRNLFSGFQEELGIRYTLPGLGFCPEQVELLCGMVSGNLANDPAASTENIIRKIYMESM